MSRQPGAGLGGSASLRGARTSLPLMMMGASKELPHSSSTALPTSEQYASRSAPLRGEFARSREQLDYAWHKRYTLARQELQDQIIRNLLSGAHLLSGVDGGREASARPRASSPRLISKASGAREMLRQAISSRKRSTDHTDSLTSPANGSLLSVSPPEQPWAIFTAGCMGAGKTRVMGVLGREGLLPLDRFVRVDQDLIRAHLPETRTLMKLDRRTVGHMTQASLSHTSLSLKALTHKSLTHKSLSLKSLSLKSLTHKSLTHKSLTHKSLTHKSLTHKSLTQVSHTSLSLSPHISPHVNAPHSSNIYIYIYTSLGSVSSQFSTRTSPAP